jgi:hypothetical protein
VSSEELAGSTPPERTEFRPSTLRRLLRWSVGVLVAGLVGVLSEFGVSLLHILLANSMSIEIVEEELWLLSVFFLSGGFFLVMAYLWVPTIGVVLLVRLISPRHGRLVFYEGKVRGPAEGAPWREVEFSLSLLDRPRSCSRGSFQRLFGYQVLHSVNGEKIYWVRATFSNEAVAQVLGRLQCA